MLKKQFLRFITVGLLATTLSYLAFFIALRVFAINYLIAACIGFIFGVCLGFFLNKNWTFDAKENKSKKTVLSYFAVYIFSLIVSLFFLKVMVEVVGLSPELGNFLGIGVSTCTNFIGTKFFVFKK